MDIHGQSRSPNLWVGYEYLISPQSQQIGSRSSDSWVPRVGPGSSHPREIPIWDRKYYTPIKRRARQPSVLRRPAPGEASLTQEPASKIRAVCYNGASLDDVSSSSPRNSGGPAANKYGTGLVIRGRATSGSACPWLWCALAALCR